jgi:hypothetical protein
MAESLLNALEGSLRIFEKHRIFLLSSSVNRPSKRIIQAPRPADWGATGRDLPSAPGWSAGANAVACARFDASQFALPEILAEPDQVQAWRHMSFSARTPVIGYKAGSRMMGLRRLAIWTCPQAEQMTPWYDLAGLRIDHKCDGPTVFAHACKLGLEGIVSKRKESTYRSGRSPDWLKMKNPACSAVKREAEEDWGRWLIQQARSVRPQTKLRHYARQLSQARRSFRRWFRRWGRVGI